MFRSSPQHPVPKAMLFGGIAVLWGAPCALGWILAAALLASKSIVPAEVQLVLYGLVYLLVFSPLFSWVGWLLAAPILWFLLRDGWFGWVSASLTGLIIGGVAGATLDTSAALLFGVVAILALRGLLGWKIALRPA